MLDFSIRNINTPSFRSSDIYLPNLLPMNYHESYNKKNSARAATSIRCNLYSDVIPAEDLNNPALAYQNIQITDLDGILLSMDGRSASSWLKSISIAKDCQSSNIILQQANKGLVLKTIKNIKANEPLQLWFDENVLAMLNMPFLLPSNIQGENRYMCHLCHENFTSPNPLKLHLALNCNRFNNDHLWSKLAAELRCSSTKSMPINIPEPFNPFSYGFAKSPSISPIPSSSSSPQSYPNSLDNSVQSDGSSGNMSDSSFSPYSYLSSSPPNTYSMHHRDYLNSSSPTSSYLPHYYHASNGDDWVKESAFQPYAITPESFSYAKENVYDCYQHIKNVSSLSAGTPNAQVAQMENIVSDLGKSKHGHQCLYCGKIYSRKYGLKIHIRIHTGYKPLKCKYCYRPFGDPSNLNKHLRLHKEGKIQYKCDICSKTLGKRSDLKRHMRLKHHSIVDEDSDHSLDEMDL